MSEVEYRVVLQRKPQTLFARWKPFVYEKRGGMLFEYKPGTNPKTSDPLTVVDLENCLIDDGDMLTGKQFSFILHTQTSKSYYFAAKNMQEKKEVIAAFTRQGGETSSQKPSITDHHSTHSTENDSMLSDATAQQKLPILGYLDSFTDPTVVGNGVAGMIVGFNAAAEKLFGFTKAEAVGQPLTILMPEPYKSQHDAFLFRHEKFGAEKLIGKTRTLRGERKNKETFPIQISLGKLPVKGYYIATMRQVSDDMMEDIDFNDTASESSNHSVDDDRPDPKLQKARNEINNYVKMMETFTDAQIVGNARTGLIYAMNPAAEKMYGYKKGQAKDKNIKVLMPEPYKSQHDGYLFRFDKTKRERLVGTTRHLQGERTNGEVFDMELSLSRLPVEGFYVATVREIEPDGDDPQLTAFCNIMKSFTDATVVGNVPDHTIFAVNPAAERLFGADANDLVGKNINILIPEPHKSKHDQYLNDFIETGRERFLGTTRKLKAEKRNGETIDVEISLSKLAVSGYVMATLREVPKREKKERKATETQL